MASPHALHADLTDVAGPLGAGKLGRSGAGVHQGNLRLHRRWRAFDARGKRTVVANAAIARELAGWYWSLAVMDA